MIDLIPAIDIIEGKCVRLTKGDYSTRKTYNDDPVAVAKDFEQMGFNRLHVVDLDGAKSSHIVNAGVLTRIKQSTRLTVDFGGGIKTDCDIEEAFRHGADMVTAGSIAVKNPNMFCRWLKRYGSEKIILAADIRNGNLAYNGWTADTDKDIFAFLDNYVAKGVSKVLCTDISKDGTLSGPAFALYAEMMRRYPSLYLIASGGVSSNEDIEQLNRDGIPAVVFGKAFYEGKLDMESLKSNG